MSELRQCDEYAMAYAISGELVKRGYAMRTVSQGGWIIADVEERLGVNWSNLPRRKPTGIFADETAA